MTLLKRVMNHPHSVMHVNIKKEQLMLCSHHIEFEMFEVLTKQYESWKREKVDITVKSRC